MNSKNIFEEQLNYIKSKNFSGYDPHDALLSPFIRKTFLNRSKWIKIFFIQFHKRSILNFRRLFAIPQHQNPKGLALIVSALITANKAEEEKELIYKLLDRLKQFKNSSYPEYCWGYPFDWQTRAFFQIKNLPNVVVTSFVGQAFLDSYDAFGDKKLLEIGLSSAEFMLKYLNRTKLKSGYSFSYSPTDNSVVFNASALGARHLARCYFYTKEEKYRNVALNAIQPLINFQNSDGSWFYGLQKHHNWVDSFHTGYNLECLYEVMKYLNYFDYDRNFKIGMDYYLTKLFTRDGFPKYYAMNRFPADTHSPAQLFVTLRKTNLLSKNIELANSVFSWWVENLYDRKNARFYYLKKQFFTNKVDYMRWTQCWALYGISYYIHYPEKNGIRDEEL